MVSALLRLFFSQYSLRVPLFRPSAVPWSIPHSLEQVLARLAPGTQWRTSMAKADTFVAGVPGVDYAIGSNGLWNCTSACSERVDLGLVSSDPCLVRDNAVKHENVASIAYRANVACVQDDHH
jgi:hypothetical protein